MYDSPATMMPAIATTAMTAPISSSPVLCRREACGCGARDGAGSCGAAMEPLGTSGLLLAGQQPIGLHVPCGFPAGVAAHRKIAERQIPRRVVALRRKVGLQV